MLCLAAHRRNANVRVQVAPIEGGHFRMEVGFVADGADEPIFACEFESGQHYEFALELLSGQCRSHYAALDRRPVKYGGMGYSKGAEDGPGGD